MKSGSDIVIEILKSENVSYVFGNPGTTELALVDALSEHREIKYILGLQEASVVGLADGYARATNRPAFINLHATAGLGNGLGALSNAAYMNTPLVVTAGQQDHRHIIDDPWLTGDLVGLAKPLCKSAHEVRSINELAVVLRRAFKDANTFPKGPVFVALPSNFMDEKTAVPVPPKSEVHTNCVAGGISDLASILSACQAGSVAIIAGDEISSSNAMQEVVALAELLGADVYGSALHDSVVFPTSHALWSGFLLPETAQMNSTLQAYKKIFVLGARGFMAYTYSPESPVPDNSDLLHLSADSNAVAMTFATQWAGVGDIKASLRCLLDCVDVADAAAAKSHLKSKSEKKKNAWIARAAQMHAALSESPIKPETASYAFVQSLPANAIVVDEAPANSFSIREFLQTNETGQYHFSKGGGLGWAMPVAVGISLDNRDKRTFCITGDGAAMYSPQAMWTAANQSLPITYVVFNNSEYGVLKNYLRKTYPENGERDDFIGMDINTPAIDYQALAASMGLASVRIDDANKISQAVEQSISENPSGPCLIEIMIAPSADV